MPTQIRAAVDHELRSAGFVSGGLAATTAVKTTGFPVGTKSLFSHVHNLSSSTVVKFALNPWLTVLKTADAGATFTDYSSVAQNDLADSGVVLSSLPTLANGGAVFVGSHLPFRGLNIDVSDVNGTASLLTADYYNGTAFVDATETDGTDSAGTALAQDGTVTFAVPSDWAAAPLRDIMDTANEPFNPTYVKPTTDGRSHVLPLYWIRLKVSAALDSATTINSIHALNRSVSYAQLGAGVPFERSLTRGFGGFGSLEYLTDAGTADFNVTIGSGNGYFG